MKLFENWTRYFVWINYGGVMHSFFKCLDWKSISDCLLAERLNSCNHFQQCFFPHMFPHPSLDMQNKFWIKIHQSPFHVTLCKCPQVQKVMQVGGDLHISICLVCFACRKMDMEMYQHWKRSVYSVESNDSD